MTPKKNKRSVHIGKTIATVMLGAALITGCATTGDGSQGRDASTGGDQ